MDHESIWKKIAQLEHQKNKSGLSRTLAGLAQDEKMDAQDKNNLPQLEQLGLLENGQLSTQIKDYVSKSYQMNFITMALEFVKLNDTKQRFEVFIPETGMEVLANDMIADEAVQNANPHK